ncbi:MAG: MmgE/PrpD family protein, partial [Desulfobacteraceae bacterium]|nr:MmgE/PrpD family protein [Desulfobacteraceae bacterium]
MKNSNLQRAVISTRLDDLPQVLVTYLKGHILNAIGSSLAGAQTKAGQKKIAAAKNVNISKEATIIGDGTKVPIDDAFQVNSYLGNLLPLNGSSYTLSSHPGRQVIYASLSASEKLKASLEDCIISTLISYELILRIGQGVQQMVWPANKQGPDPALGFCFSLSDLAGIARKALCNNTEDVEPGILFPLILDTLDILHTDVESNTRSYLELDKDMMKLSAVIE